MKTIYLIRHSLKENSIADNKVNKQVFDEQKSLSSEGEALAYDLSKLDILKDINEVWASNYKRAIDTARYLGDYVNISADFDERHYGDLKDIDKEEFWIAQFLDKKLKNPDGESQEEVRNRFDRAINKILKESNNEEVAIVSHNAAILFYLLKYCKLEKAVVPKKITMSYNNKVIIEDDIMHSPSIMKLLFDDDNKLTDIEYIDL